MKNTIRCCISCILPCGALDVIRIVHSNGRVDEITGTIRASDILKAYPKHVLKKPTTRPCYDDCPSSATAASCRPAIVVVPPESQLQRGKIYFLIPAVSTTPPSGGKKKKSSSSSSTSNVSQSTTVVRKKKREQQSGSNNSSNNNVVLSDQYLSEILSEKMTSSTQRERRRGRVAVWRPHLESISETLSEAASSIC